MRSFMDNATVKLGNKIIEKNTSALYIIAEVGSNFYESASEFGTDDYVSTIKKYIDAIVERNLEIDAVKFQIYREDMLASKELAKRQYYYFKRHNLMDRSDWEEVAAYCSENGLEFMATFFDEGLIDEYADLVSSFKIASPDIINYSLIRRADSYKKTIILSTGGATFEEIDAALKQIEHSQVAIMHCNVEYGFSENEYARLIRIRQMAARYPDIVIGYSDHYIDTDMLTSAYLVGANIIEKHFALKEHKTLNSLNDFYHSATEESFEKELKFLHNAASRLGDTDDKDFTEEEKDNRKFGRRSFFAARDIDKNEIIVESAVVRLRPCKDGICASEEDLVLGKVAAKKIKKGEQLTKKHFTI